MAGSRSAGEAIQRALPLLEPSARSGARQSPAGYLDLLTDREPTSTGPAQDLMLTRLVPTIYERWWRPGLARLAKGLLGPGMAEEHRIAQCLLELAPGDGVLDVACGPGNFTRGFARTVGAAGLAAGIDASATMLARGVADTQADNLAFIRGDAVELPFRDCSWDAVCCFAALHLFADPTLALDHMTRVLTPGGRIALFTSCRTRSAALRTLDGLVGAGSGMRMFDRDELTAMLTERGFTDVRQQVCGFTQFVGARRP